MTENPMAPVIDPMEALIAQWCDRRDVRSLAIVLPAWVGNAGLTDGWAAVLEALYDLRSTRRLPDEEQAEIERLIPTVEGAVYRR